MVFSDLEIVTGEALRNVGYARDNIFRIWTPGSGKKQQGFCRELAGALFREADEFFDRSLVLYLLRTRLRTLQASTWGDVATYYSNYFCATSFMRLHLNSVTHLPSGDIFEVEPDNARSLVFKISSRGRRLSHRELWTRYYALVVEMGWPDASAVSLLSPSVAQLQFREQNFRERVNYRAGDGFDEIYLTPTRYVQSIRSSTRTIPLGIGVGSLNDSSYNDHLAGERLRHMAALLGRLRTSRKDTAIEDSIWERRRLLAERYGATLADRRFAAEILQSNR